MKKTIAAFLLFPLLGGCLSLTSTQAPPTTYVLRAADRPDAAAALRTATAILTIDEPVMAAGLETDRIALALNGGRQLEYYTGAKWPVSLENMIQDVAVQAGHSSLPNLIFTTQDLNIASQYRLVLHVTDFTPIYPGAATTPPHLRETINFTLIRLADQAVLSDFTLTSEQPAGANDLSSVTAGLEKILQGILTQAFQTLGEALPATAQTADKTSSPDL